MKKVIIILPLALTSCANTRDYGFFPQQEDSIVWEYQNNSNQNLLDSPDGHYRVNSGTVIWSSNPR